MFSYTFVSADSKVFRVRADAGREAESPPSGVERTKNEVGVVFYARSVAHWARAKLIRTREMGIKLQ